MSTPMNAPMKRSPRAHLSLLLPALALLLGALGLFAAAPAEAQNDGTVWSATLTPQTHSIFPFTTGCDNGDITLCSTQSVLSDDGFTYRGVSYEFEYIFWSNSLGFSFKLGNAGVIPADRLPFLTLYVGNVALKFGDANVSQPSVYIWSTHRNLQTAGVPATLRIVDHSTDATLRDLTARWSLSPSGPFGDFPFAPGTTRSGAFEPSVTAYETTVASDHEYLSLRPRVNAPGATVKVGKGSDLTPVASGAYSAAIPIAMGHNEFVVEVTAEDGTTTETYTVTMTRVRPAPVTRPGDTVWSSYHVPAAGILFSGVGCDNGDPDSAKYCSNQGTPPQNPGPLQDGNTFTYLGVDYEVRLIYSGENNVLQFQTTPAIPENLRPLLTLYVLRAGRPDVALNFADAEYDTGADRPYWENNPNLLRAGEGVTLALHAQELPPLTPHPDGLTALTVNDGVRNLKFEPNVPGRVGFGGPEHIYTVHVPPGRRSVTVTPEWTNTSLSALIVEVFYTTYGNVRLPNDQLPAWNANLSNSGTGEELPLIVDGLSGEGATLLKLELVGPTEITQPYRIYLIHNRDWQSSHDWLTSLEMTEAPE